MGSVLDGVRVIDFGQYIAGPLTGMLLADQGADVIRVDPPGGPLWDRPANATLNRNKRSVTLNLKQPDELAIATRLIESADVIKIDNPTRGGYVASHNDVNRGKRSILLDLKSEAGRDVFWRLLADADVV